MSLNFLETVLGGLGLDIVEHATDLDFIGNQSDKMKTPSVFYHPWSENSPGLETIDNDDQQIEVTFGLKVVARNTELDAIRDSIRKALIGHMEPGFLSPIAYNSGQVIDVQRSIIWWRDLYSFQTLVMS